MIEWNQAIERLTGIKKNDIIGKSNYAYAVLFWKKPRPVLIDFVLNGDSLWENEYLSLTERDEINGGQDWYEKGKQKGIHYLQPNYLLSKCGLVENGK